MKIFLNVPLRCVVVAISKLYIRKSFNVAQIDVGNVKIFSGVVGHVSLPDALVNEYGEKRFCLKVSPHVACY